MSIFGPIQRRIRSFFRQRMAPMSVDEALEKKEFFSRLYFVSSLLAFCYVFYKICKAPKPSITPEEAIKKFHIPDKVRVIRFEGFKKVADYYTNEDDIDKKQSKPQDINPEFPVEVEEQQDSEFLKG